MTAYCDSDGIASGGTYAFPATRSLSLPGDVSSTIATLWAPMFQLNFKSTDVTPTASTPRSADTPLATSSGSAMASAAADSSLSKGAIAGIAVGAVLGGFILGGAAAMILLRRYRRNRAVDSSNAGMQQRDAHQSDHSAPVEIDGGMYSAKEQPPVELPAHR